MYSLNGIPFLKKTRTDGHTDRQTNERTDGRSDYIMPQILFGGIKSAQTMVQSTMETELFALT